LKTLLQVNTIFLSMIMEAAPFVLVGVIVSGLIETFMPERWIARAMPRNRLLQTLLGCGMGVLFPGCECGIVPITRRLLSKGLSLNAGIAFMLTGPVINPIVLFATYIAFGNDWRMAAIRAGAAIAVACAVALVLPAVCPELPDRLQAGAAPESASAAELGTNAAAKPSGWHRWMHAMNHAVDEFFSIGKFLVIGAFVAASMQTFLPTGTLLHLGASPVTASLLMMALAYVMSLCSEADAFIAASFRSTFRAGALSAFMVFGPMIDLKNTLMLLGIFRGKFVAWLIALLTVFTLLASLLVERWFA